MIMIAITIGVDTRKIFNGRVVHPAVLLLLGTEFCSDSAKFACMPKQLPSGIRGQAEITVAHEHTLNYHSPELPPIYSTPHMIGLMEWAAANAMKPYCDPGEISVGTAINIEHRAPTIVGQQVCAEAQLESTKGKFYIFRVTARNETHLIGCGTVTRAFVNPEKVAAKFSLSGNS
jgi:fluoroacetyl-CoA thioesterase